MRAHTHTHTHTHTNTHTHTDTHKCTRTHTHTQAMKKNVEDEQLFLWQKELDSRPTEEDFLGHCGFAASIKDFIY